MDRVDRHDVGVLELGQQPWLIVAPGCDLEDDEAIREVSLSGQVDGPEGAFPEYLEQVESEEITANSGADSPPLGLYERKLGNRESRSGGERRLDYCLRKPTRFDEADQPAERGLHFDRMGWARLRRVGRGKGQFVQWCFPVTLSWSRP